MPRIVPINPSDFCDKAWRKPTGYSFAANQAVAPLVAAEFPKAASAIPIAFIEQEERFIPVAVLSPLPGRNLFVGPAGQWLGTYVPASLRSHPFLLARGTAPEEVALCIEQDSELIVPAGDPNAAPFFGPDGRPSEPTAAVLSFLSALERNREATTLAIGALAEAGIIQPWLLNVAVDDEQREVKGLFKIDEAALNALSDEAFILLRRSGALPLAYLQLVSTAQIILFEQLSRTQEQLANPSLKQSAAAMEELFALIDPKGQLFG